MTIDRHGVNDGHGPSAEARGEQPLTPDGQDGRYRYEGKQHLSHRTLPVRCYRNDGLQPRVGQFDSAPGHLHRNDLAPAPRSGYVNAMSIALAADCLSCQPELE